MPLHPNNKAWRYENARSYNCHSNLVEAGEYVVSELDLSNSGSARSSYSDTEPNDSLLRQRCVEYPGCAWKSEMC
jgi:hypothetical protein